MSETTATVTIREVGRFSNGDRRFEIEWPNGEKIDCHSELSLSERGLPVPPLPIPDPPEGCMYARDRDGVLWTSITSITWRAPLGGQRVWQSLVEHRGPVTPLIPGDPIEAP